VAQFEIRHQWQIPAARLVTRTLKLLGVRERVWDARKARARRRRLIEEAAGSDRLSRPALHGLEDKLDRIISKRGGFFVEAGANDGFTQSNTYWLERFRGWRGLLIEPMPTLAREARLERPATPVVHCALVPADFAGETIEMRFGDLLSTVRGAGSPTGEDEEAWTRRGVALGWRDPYVAAVPARTLSSVLDEAGAPEIDLLSLDVEGFEADVLRGLDLDRHAPRWLCVEVHPERGRQPVEEVLGDRFVFHEVLSPIDVLYRRRDV
jgi:FkbM family methyltransferase